MSQQLPSTPSELRTAYEKDAKDLQARLGYIQMQLDVLNKEKRSIVTALQHGETAHRLLEPLKDPESDTVASDSK